MSDTTSSACRECLKRGLECGRFCPILAHKRAAGDPSVEVPAQVIKRRTPAPVCACNWLYEGVICNGECKNKPKEPVVKPDKKPKEVAIRKGSFSAFERGYVPLWVHEELEEAM